MKFVSHLIHSLERKLSCSLSVENVFGKGWKGREKLLSMMYLALKNMENVEIFCGIDCDRDIGGKANLCNSAYSLVIPSPGKNQDFLLF